MHKDSGLLDALQYAEHSVTDIECIVISALKARGYTRGQVQIAGFSIAFDRAYIKEWMPDLDAFLHYRMIDVTSILEFLSIDPKFVSADSVAEHRALADCYAARRELIRCAEHVGIDFGGKLDELKAAWTPPVGRPLVGVVAEG
jgi:oligoribonuclease